eukprot:6917658-Alexandrium_andersonii.AAC.1
MARVNLRRGGLQSSGGGFPMTWPASRAPVMGARGAIDGPPWPSVRPRARATGVEAQCAPNGPP